MDYRSHMSRHLTGAQNPRAAMREGAMLWRGGATRANPRSGDQVTRYAIVGVLLYLGLTWLGPKLQQLQTQSGQGGLAGLLSAGSLDDCGCGSEAAATPINSAQSTTVGWG